MKDLCLLCCHPKEYLLVRDFVGHNFFDILKDNMRLSNAQKKERTLKPCCSIVAAYFFEGDDEIITILIVDERFIEKGLKHTKSPTERRIIAQVSGNVFAKEKMKALSVVIR
jgi:hypothetical protein